MHKWIDFWFFLSVNSIEKKMLFKIEGKQKVADTWKYFTWQSATSSESERGGYSRLVDSVYRFRSRLDIQSQVKDDLKKLDIIYAWSPIIMALPVMEFQDQGYKIRKIFAWRLIYPKEIIEFWD